MKNLIKLQELSHRSKDRIKDLGEVFTPESYVEDMLGLLSKDDKKFWADEEVVFFEPCCGHGNIVLSIYKRRLKELYKKALSRGLKEAPYYAVANALNTLWAIDIDFKNVENCRSRVLFETLEFLKEKTNSKSHYALLSGNKDFFTHVVSAIKWQIFENETLSALSSEGDAKTNANLTKTGAKWFGKNGHRELDFDLTWSVYFESCEDEEIIPIEYQRSKKFIESILSGRVKGFDDYEFAKTVVSS